MCIETVCIKKVSKMANLYSAVNVKSDLQGASQAMSEQKILKLHRLPNNNFDSFKSALADFLVKSAHSPTQHNWASGLWLF